MKAVRYYGPNQPLRLEEIPKPTISPGEVLVKINAAAICHTDLHFISGLLNLGVAPITLGHEMAGTVEQVGSGVERSLEGARVAVYYYSGCQNCHYCRHGMENLCPNIKAENGFITDGGYAEYIKIPARNAVPLPEQISFQTAAPIGCSLATAVHAGNLVQLKQGDNAVVYGVGGVGYSVIQLARLSGANVIAVGRTPAKLNKAKELGAQHIINASTESVVDEVRRVTGGHGADVIFELVGTRESMENSVKFLAKRGKLAFIGYSQDSFVVHPISLVINEAHVIGSVGNTLDELYRAVKLVADGKVKIVIGSVLKLSQFSEGFKSVSDGTAVGKIVLVP